MRSTLILLAVGFSLFPLKSFPKEKNDSINSSSDRTFFYGDSVCSNDSLEEYVEKIATWSELKNLFQKCGRRDKMAFEDGDIGEGLDDRIEWLFDNKLDRFFSSYNKNDSAYLKLVMWHVNEDWSRQDIDKLKFQLGNSCPKGSKPVCIDLISWIARLDSLINN